MTTPATFAFVAAGHDRADALRDDETGLVRAWQRARVILVDDEGRLLALAEGVAPWLPDTAGLPAALREQASFLGLDGEQAYFALDLEQARSAGLVLPEATSRTDLRSAAANFQPLHARLGAHARALLHWRRRKRFCGVCGMALAFTRGGHQAACPGCGSVWYPRTDAAIIVAVSDGERLLLGRQAGWPEGRYSVLAGFVEPGESLEDAVRREVMEEAGIAVADCGYSGSQPWPFPSSLMVGFHARAVSAAPPVCGSELEDARWFTAADIRGQCARGTLRLSPRLSISRQLVEDWLAARPE